jgi:hypothetical protein
MEIAKLDQAEWRNDYEKYDRAERAERDQD